MGEVLVWVTLIMVSSPDIMVSLLDTAWPMLLPLLLLLPMLLLLLWLMPLLLLWLMPLLLLWLMPLLSLWPMLPLLPWPTMLSLLLSLSPLPVFIRPSRPTWFLRLIWSAIRSILRSITCPRSVWTPGPPATSPTMSSTIPLSMELLQQDMSCPLEPTELDTSLDTMESLLEPSPPPWLLLSLHTE